jgi:DNA-binding NtrC family response regulator
MSVPIPRLLIVDDEMIMREYLADIFQDEGFEVVKVNSGESAIEHLDREAFDLVIADMKMPGISGIEVFQHARDKQPNAKVILITAYSMDMSGKQYLEEGAYGFILKPFELNDIRKMVFAALGKKDDA